MQFTSDFVPGQKAYLFDGGKVVPVLVTGVMFVSVGPAGGFSSEIHTVDQDGVAGKYAPGDGLHVTVESVLESLLPESLKGSRISISREETPTEAPSRKRPVKEKPVEATPPVEVVPPPAPGAEPEKVPMPEEMPEPEFLQEEDREDNLFG